MGFWALVDEVSDGIQFPKRWNLFINWIFLIQLTIAIGSCYINGNMWPIYTVKQSFAVLQIKAMLIVQIVLFYWEIAFTHMFFKDFNIAENHIMLIIHSAFLLYKQDSICGVTLLPYLFYSITWTFGGGSSLLFFFIFLMECYLYIFQTLYAYRLQKTLFIGFPLIALYQMFSNYKLYCWTLDGNLCPSERIISLFGTYSISFIIVYLIIIVVIYSVTVVPFYAILKKLENYEKQNMSISDSIENLNRYNPSINSFKNK
ncbi:hypothetical protein BCR32DRAFT_269523 [Anaeromyces robustus]|uniref:Transmembrane protein n=1 Tax=Anaeromyces robustus TaxID=1754192 RepID=A0A1Y1X0W0_9FUNG|nr:hypothetical protein BCR32DRAFT_269523 [Anaeromyces robustus]|eukprot:ORX79393.1 hypothetical protein BCR32DRAFT_269523 [Anaeromyces robustus]